MNQIESLYQPSFQQHPYEFNPQTHQYAAGPSPLSHHFASHPQSPVAPAGQHEPGRHGFAGHVQTKAQSPGNIAPGQSQSHQFHPAAVSQGVAAPVLSPTKQQPVRSPHTGSASPQKYPMAAPPLPASVLQQSPKSNTSGSLPSSPQASAHAAREKQRVALLLDINLELLQEMNKLQAEGNGGAPNAQQAAAMKAQGGSDKIASDEYIQVYFRVSSNISYLYNQPEMQLLNPQNAGQIPPKRSATSPPQFMWPPAHMPTLHEKYAALRKLFPGWVGRDAPTGYTDGQ